MVRHVGFAILTVALVACASPSNVGTGGTRPGTSNGPGVDLGGFITPESADLASGTLFDFAIAAASDMALADMKPADMNLVDMALASTPDMAQASTACGTITYSGQCTANTLRYCSSSQLTTVDCAAGGRQCTVVAGDADCRFVAGAACGSVTTDGLCDGDTLVYCNGSNKITMQNCASSGATCDSFLGIAICY